MTELRKKLIISGFAFCLIAGASFALNEDTKNYFDPINVMDSVLNFSIAKEESFNSVVSSGTLAFSDARQKFIHGNITASYSEFQKIISKLKNDRELLNISKYLYSEGFYSLAREATSKIKNQEKFSSDIENLKTTYETNFSLLDEEEKLLLNYISSVKYQNLAQEVAFELKNNKNLMKKSDVANYIMANAFYSLKQNRQALNFIKTAIKLNSKNINYKLLEAKILFDSGKSENALKIAEDKKYKNSILKDEFLNLKYQILAQNSKTQAEKKLNEAKLSYLDNNYYKAIQDVNFSISQDGENIEAYDILFKSLLKINDVYAAQKVIKRMEEISKKSPKTLEAKGDIEFINSKYGSAYKYWKKANKNNDRLILNKLMLVNSILLNKEENEKLAKKLVKLPISELNENLEISTGILNNAIYLGTLGEDIKGAIYSLKIYYLKKAIDVEPFKLVNWLEFTDISLNKNKNINSIIISMASYLGEFNYYYYWVLANLEDANSNLEKAFEYYQKSSNLNPLFEPAKKRVEELKL